MSSDVLLNPISPLRHVSFGSLLPRVGGGGGGGAAPASQTVTQTNLPEYAEPYFRRLLERSEAVSLGEYQPFEGQRQAALPGDVSAAYDVTRQVAGQGVAGLPQAMGVTASNIEAGQQIAQQSQPFQYDPAGQFTAETAQQYMSPYMQAVVDEQSRRAIQQFQEQRGARASQAVSAGAFGGSRQAVQESLAERALSEQLGGIQAQGLQQAFQQGAGQFGADRAARFAVEQAQSAADVQSRQAQLQALGFSAEQAQQMVGFGEAGRAADIQSAQLLENIGRSQMGREQEALDIAYQDFVRQQAFPEQQLQGLSSILRGVPVQPGVTQTAYAPYNPLQQALGAGLGAIGLYRGLTG
jgi:hypothetical protein